MSTSRYTRFSHVPGKRNARALGTALTVAAAAALGGLAFPSPAHAEVIDQVAVYGNTKADVERWGAGWDRCKAENPKTKSAKQDGASGPTGTEGKWVAYWQCFDTTDST
jgi:hypothetical protein